MGDFKLGRVPANKWEILNSGESLPISGRFNEGSVGSLFVGSGGILAEEFKIYSISDNYIEYLQRHVPNVYSNKVEHRVHTRKYVGVVLRIGKYNYYIPMSSPKETDYQVAGVRKVIKKSIIPIIRVTTVNSNNEKELKGTLRISHMLPVPEAELELFDMETESDEAYKDLVNNEMIFIRKNKEKILKNAQVMYKQKCENDTSAEYVKTALDYKQLEQLCDEYRENKTSGGK